MLDECAVGVWLQSTRVHLSSSEVHTSHPSVCLIWEQWDGPLSCRVEALTTSRAPNKEGQAGRGTLCKYPSGLRKTEEGSWGGRGKRMDCSLIWTKHCFSQGLWLWPPAWRQMLRKQLLSTTKRYKWSNATVEVKHVTLVWGGNYFSRKTYNKWEIMCCGEHRNKPQTTLV